MSCSPPEASRKLHDGSLYAMGGDDYNYYSDFTTTVSSSSSKRSSLNSG